MKPSWIEFMMVDRPALLFNVFLLLPTILFWNWYGTGVYIYWPMATIWYLSVHRLLSHTNPKFPLIFKWKDPLTLKNIYIISSHLPWVSMYTCPLTEVYRNPNPWQHVIGQEWKPDPYQPNQILSPENLELRPIGDLNCGHRNWGKGEKGRFDDVYWGR
jgi:hypothetical protein